MPFDIEEVRHRLAGLERTEASEIREAVTLLARPRMTGTEGAAEVDGVLRERFEALGYDAETLAFSLSTLPGRFAISVAGTAAALAGIFGAWLLTAGVPGGALAVLMVGAAATVAPIAFAGRASEQLQWGRAEASNLLFTRPGSRPSWVLMAHRDTKSQLVPSLVRTLVAAAAAVSWLTLVALGILRLADDALQLPTLTSTAGLLLAAAGLVLALSWARNGSPGALDNASGLAALLAVARRSDDVGDVAFLVTDAEELGLAGARAVVGRLPPVQGVINVDGLDDSGEILVAEGAGWSRKGTAPQLAAALLRAGAALGFPVSRRPLPRWLAVDHLPLAAAGVPALTVLKGTAESLLRVHRPTDGADRLDGRGAAQVATLLAAALTLLRSDGTPHLARRRATGS